MSSRFETTYNRDFGKLFRKKSQKQQFSHIMDFHDSGISSDDELLGSPRDKEKFHRSQGPVFQAPECDLGCDTNDDDDDVHYSRATRASNYEYIHHINPTEHNQRYKKENCCCSDFGSKQTKDPTSRSQKRNNKPMVRKYKPVSSKKDVGDWYQCLNQQLYQTQRILESTEQMRQNAKHLIDEKNAKARKAKLLAEKELDYRIEAERRQLSKLKREVKEHEEVDGKLLQVVKRLKKLIERVETTFETSNLLRKSKCKDIQSCLVNERTVAKRNVERIETVLAKLEDHRKCCSKIHRIMKDDIEKKVQAIGLDVRAKECSMNNIYNLTKDNQHASHSLDHWQEHSDFIINKSKEIRIKCESLLDECLRVGVSVKQEMEGVWEETNQEVDSYIRRRQEMDRRCQENQLSMDRESVNLEETLKQLKMNLRKLEKQLQIATNRMVMRSGKLDLEMCRDGAHEALDDEISYIRESKKLLENRINEASKALQVNNEFQFQ